MIQRLLLLWEKRCLILSPAVTSTRSLFSVSDSDSVSVSPCLSLPLLLGWLCLMEWLHSSPGKMMAKRGSLRKGDRRKKKKKRLWNLRDFVLSKRSTDWIERNELLRFHCQAMREKRDKFLLLNLSLSLLLPSLFLLPCSSCLSTNFEGGEGTTPSMSQCQETQSKVKDREDGELVSHFLSFPKP